MAQKIGLNGNGEGDKVSALKKAVKNLVEFIEKGGVVDFVAPTSENEAEEDEYGELRVSFEEIRRLEKKLHGIEHKTE